MSGHVYLVGAGPGDMGLMTVRGLELLRNADIVVYDALIDPLLLSECKNAKMINVGKRSSDHTKTQDEINDLLVELASSGKDVVRLKGGDPFLFGRGAEEALALRNAGISVSVIPGVSSSISVPELAGIPVTHRNRSSIVTIVTGHEMDDKSSPIDWEHLAGTAGTIVILMGMKSSERISRSLISGGMSAETPVAIITDGASERQHTETTVLKCISQTIKEKGLKAPGIIVIGNVVLEREEIGDLF